MRKNILLVSFLTFALVSCSEEKDPFLIDQNQIGVLTRDIKVNQLDSVFAQDSLVRQVNEGEFFRNTNEIKIYDKNGDFLLLLEPVQAFDSTSTIGFVQIMDPRFHTKKGLNLNSTFKDIVENYSISRIENTLNSAVVFIDELHAYITIDKKELPPELRYNNAIKISPSQIPNDAQFKYFMVSW